MAIGRLRVPVSPEYSVLPLTSRVMRKATHIEVKLIRTTHIMQCTFVCISDFSGYDVDRRTWKARWSRCYGESGRESPRAGSESQWHEGWVLARLWLIMYTGRGMTQARGPACWSRSRRVACSVASRQPLYISTLT